MSNTAGPPPMNAPDAIKRDDTTRGARSAILIIALATFLVSCNPRQEVVASVAAGPDITARWRACPGSTGGPTNQTVLEKSGWTDGKLMIDVRDNDNCGGTVVSDLGYTVDGETVRLHWTWKPKQGPGGVPSPLTACACDHAIRFELSNIPVRDYNIVLARSK